MSDHDTNVSRVMDDATDADGWTARDDFVSVIAWENDVDEQTAADHLDDLIVAGVISESTDGTRVRANPAKAAAFLARARGESFVRNLTGRGRGE